MCTCGSTRGGGGAGLSLQTGPTRGLLVASSSALLSPTRLVGGVGDKKYRASFSLKLADTVQALELEQLVTDGEHLVDDEDIRFHVHRHGEPESHVHARREVLHLLVDERFEF